MKTLFPISRQIPLGLGQGCIGHSLGCEWPTQHRQNSPSKEYHTCKSQICSGVGGEQHSPASSQTTGTHQQERYRCRRSLSESLLMVTHRKALGPGTAGHGGQQCQPGRTGAAGSAPWECRKMCPDYGCVSRGGKNTWLHTCKTATPLPGSSGVFRSFSRKNPKFAAHSGIAQPCAPPRTAPVPALPSPVPAPITDAQTLHSRGCLAAAPARGSGTRHGT